MTDVASLQSDLLTQIAGAADEAALEAVRVGALGKKGSISELMKTLGGMSPDARKVMTDIARGAANPDLQVKAIKYLGVNATNENRQLLAEVYQSLTDVDIKRQILRAYIVSGDRARVLAAATGEKAPEVRMEAVRQLGGSPRSSTTRVRVTHLPTVAPNNPSMST